MTEKERKQLLREFDIELCQSCKEGNLARISYLIGAGASIFYDGLRPLALAVKRNNFDVVDLLIDAGVLDDKRAVNLIASACEYKSLNDTLEQRFFATLDKAIEKGGECFDYFVPYINTVLVHGKMDRLLGFLQRYNISKEEAAAAVYTRMIFEIISSGLYDSLMFVMENVDWMTQANLDIAVSSLELDAVRFILDNSSLSLPSPKAILSVIYEGNIQILELLRSRGWNPTSNPIYLKKACHAFFSGNDASLRFLLDCGYTLCDHYDGRSIKENALIDNNTALLAFLEKYNQDQ